MLLEKLRSQGIAEALEAIGYDCERIFGELTPEAEELYASYSWRKISCSVEMCIRDRPFNAVMTIYHLFYYSKPWARVSGRFVPFRDVKRAAPFDAAFKRNVLDAAARIFSGHLEELHRACRALNGKPLNQGDAGYQIDAFDCMPLQFIFWDGDDAFPAQANILFDADITDFLHEETVVCVGDELLRRLAEESGLADVRRPFGVR